MPNVEYRVFPAPPVPEITWPVPTLSDAEFDVIFQQWNNHHPIIETVETKYYKERLFSTMGIPKEYLK